MPSLKGLEYLGFIRFYLQMRPCQPEIPTMQDRRMKLYEVLKELCQPFHQNHTSNLNQ